MPINIVTINLILFLKSGGCYSGKAFNIIYLWPRTYGENNTQNARSFFDKTDTIRLEANIKYFFAIYSFFKGAVFADAGKIWNSFANPDFDGKDTLTSNFIIKLSI